MTTFTEAQLRAAMKTTADNFESGKWEWIQGFYSDGSSNQGNGAFCIAGACAEILAISAIPLVDEGWLDDILNSCVSRLFPCRSDHYIPFNDHQATTKADVIAVLHCGAES